jgi:hypothetical protein
MRNNCTSRVNKLIIAYPTPAAPVKMAIGRRTRINICLRYVVEFCLAQWNAAGVIARREDILYTEYVLFYIFNSVGVRLDYQTGE